MKLTMKNGYTFQQMSGHPDDPELMFEHEVKDELMRWSQVIGSWMEGDRVVLDQIAGLDGFLAALAGNEVEFEEHLTTWCYYAGFEYYGTFEVIAESQEEADEKALEKFKTMANEMPQQINGSKGCFKYLEQFEPDWGCRDRIYED